MTERNKRSRHIAKRTALDFVRKMEGQEKTAEKAARSARNSAKFKLGRPISRRDMYAVRRGSGKRIGIFALGGCDVRSIVGAGPTLAPHINGALCICAPGKADHTRSDLLLQTLDPPDPSLTREVSERLHLRDDYFSPMLFEPTFRVPDQRGIGEFPKKVVVLSLSSDSGRTLYRHRDDGYLVDPGGWWLTTDMQDVLSDSSAVKWFSSNFVKTRRIAVDQSIKNFAQIIERLRTDMGAFVVMMNVLTVDPGSSSLDYKHANSPNRVRRREFGLAATELAAKMNFPVLDVDRLTKEMGISGQLDFVHYTQEQKKLISKEFAHLLLDANVI